MARWEPGAADRLADAALELFLDQGYSATTIPEIASKAGLTTRSFFRHFADKREVLFRGMDDLPDVAARIFAEADPAATPLQVIADGLMTVVAVRFDGMHDYLRRRREVIRADGALRERELRKLGVLHDAAVIGFAGRGLDQLQTAVAAQLAVVVYDTAVDQWLDGPAHQELAAVMAEVVATLTDLAH